MTPFKNESMIQTSQQLSDIFNKPWKVIKMKTSITKYLLIVDSLIRAYSLGQKVSADTVRVVYNVPLKEASKIVNNFYKTKEGI